MEASRDGLAAVNLKHQADKAFIAILYGLECFHTKEYYKKWNARITHKYEVKYDVVRGANGIKELPDDDSTSARTQSKQ